MSAAPLTWAARLAAALAAGAFAGAALAATVPPAPPAEPTVRVVLKFVKAGGGRPAPAVRFLADSCAACAALHDPAFERDNRRETLLALVLPDRRTLELRFRAPAGTVKRVLLESGDLRFETAGDIVTVQVPPLGYDAVGAGEVATHIVEPGMVLRFEHADPARRAGAYADGPFPALQRRAADHLEFAQREVIRRTGLGDYVAREKLGTIHVMGFDTNYPHGHTDAPPHTHMHLRWPSNAGTQIGHYYIGADGLLERNEVGIKDLEAPGASFGRGKDFTTRDLRGRPVYTHQITAEGWLRLGRAGQAPCLIRPLARGFDGGAVVACPGQPEVAVKVDDDLAAGVLRVATGAVQEVFRYDPGSGKLLSAAGPPPVTESNYPPAD
ncbi:hypothetical protein [Burkholderia sp. LMU1-1-1.1]|uniref:hypothetical protein n=1 Tax=Burkholderia sp. LMU1-1-1.1 TaxID=3135266 RepID=UPI00341229C1